MYIDYDHKERHELAQEMLKEYLMVTESKFTYTQLGYKTLSGEIPAVKLIDHDYIRSMIDKHRPKPKQPLAIGGRQKHGR